MHITTIHSVFRPIKYIGLPFGSPYNTANTPINTGQCSVILSDAGYTPFSGADITFSGADFKVYGIITCFWGGCRHVLIREFRF